jgi:multiple sugar transport system ATP-binding protein
MQCALNGVEVMGRDIIVVSHHDACENTVIRSIISTSQRVDTSGATVQFALLPDKVFLFDRTTGERIRMQP